MKRNPETGETATQPLPAQTADLSISGLRLVDPPCTTCHGCQPNDTCYSG